MSLTWRSPYRVFTIFWSVLAFCKASHMVYVSMSKRLIDLQAMRLACTWDSQASVVLMSL